ncbi:MULTISPECIES: CynX/NimT family MFS transporter [Bacillus]|uniref:MFS transporter n=1 Tax=Bacillus TaxID=1386 RepID=UPI000D03165B|nr:MULTISPECIES: O-antigen polysaccharide polymerase Wzy [Bacillus]MBV7318194.1 O-antigen polysaccharide polymerase Wzy [Halalkalibacterium halodurans]AZV50833.1 O-antigen polysaccharide polymerase Wzy [Bacillus halotolerans]MCP9298912.1 O-antigen polysaccharide polymerase Wzy [Bacillus halotolerans]MCV0022918.1 O-antigen polysaccharide polymerase Wzy [Bacillus sp. XT-2]MEC3641151.1 O-antigen polysaccharide polymerase Wzy [Bacillus halotolerans]
MKKKGNIYIIWSIFSLFVISMSLRASITSISPVLKTIQADLQMSNVSVSLLTALPVFCMGVFAPVAAKLSQRWGIELTIAFSVLLIGLATALRFMATFPFLLLMTAVLTGIGIAIAGPLISGYIKKQFPKYSSSMIGVYSAGMGVGASLSSGLVVPAMHSFNNSWNIALAIWALFAGIGIIVWMPIIKKSKLKKSVEGESVKQKNQLPWRNRYVWLLMVIFGLQSGMYYSFATWLAPKVQEVGFSATYAATTATVFSIIQMIFSFIIPILINNNPNRKPWIILCALCYFIGIITLIAGSISPIISAILTGIGAGGLFPIAMILPLDATTTPRDASQWTAMIQFGGYIISGAVPILVGAAKDITNSYNFAFFLLLFISIILMLLTLKVRKKKESNFQINELKTTST